LDQITVNKHIEATAKTVFSYCLARTHSKEEAEDLSQDILLEILKSACNLRSDKAFYTFMWSVANNVYKNWCKKKSRRNQTFSELDDNIPDDNEDLDSALIKNEEVNLLRRELSFLSDKYRTAAVLYYSNDYSVAQVSQTLAISESMVKYLLFKARKILKEGIGMDREFGEKSYKPSNFHYNVIFDGWANNEYNNLFNRKIPGNILMSAYYTPMTVTELSVELGISSVYMEDELALLEKYNLIKSVGELKYQTNIAIFTLDYMIEWFKMLDKNYTATIGDIIGLIKEALPKIREIGFRGCDLPENNILWSLYTLTLFNGNWNRNKSDYSRVLYSKETGAIYGTEYEDTDVPYYSTGFAGISSMDNYACTFANFNVIDKRIYGIDDIKNDLTGAKFPVFKHDWNKRDLNALPDDDYGKTITLLMPAIDKLIELFEEICENGVEIFKSHVPKSIANDAEAILHNVLFFKVIGWLGAAAINSGALEKPNSDDIVSVCAYIV
jgi:RNA polymerase sigma factor, sigma-70 family